MDNLKVTRNKTLIYLGVVFFVLVLAGFLFVDFGKISGDTIKEIDNVDLSKYRSDEIPEECQLPPSEGNVESWKEHLSHHENTLYCLDYYK